MTRRVLPTLLVALLAAAGCGGGGGDKEQPATQASATPAPTQTATATATRTKPKVRVPSGKPPKRLVKTDLEKGTGPAAESGKTVTVQYVGVSFDTHKQFDASWDRHQPFSFPLGAGQVIPGWDKGVVGMRVGGRRRLVIPPTLGYGAQGSPPVIAPNETLVFVIDLLALH